MVGILTNTYSEAPSWIDDNSDKVDDELPLVADNLERSNDEQETPSVADRS